MAGKVPSTNSEPASSLNLVGDRARGRQATTTSTAPAEPQKARGRLTDDQLRAIFQRSPLTAAELRKLLEDVRSRKQRLEEEDRRPDKKSESLAERDQEAQNNLDRALGRIAEASRGNSSLNQTINVAVAAERKDRTIQDPLLFAGRRVMRLARAKASLEELGNAVRELEALVPAALAAPGITTSTTHKDGARDEALREVAHRLDLFFERKETWDHLQSPAAARNNARWLDKFQSWAKKGGLLLEELPEPLRADLEATFNGSKFDAPGRQEGVEPFSLSHLGPILIEVNAAVSAVRVSAVRDGRDNKRVREGGLPLVRKNKNWMSLDRLASNLEGLYQLCIDKNVPIKQRDEQGAFVDAKRGEENGPFVKFVRDCCKAFGRKPLSVSTLQKMRPRRQSHFTANK